MLSGAGKPALRHGLFVFQAEDGIRHLTVTGVQTCALPIYGSGAGSYNSVSGLGNAGNYNSTTTPEIVNNDIKAVFVTLFGSWLGDWDHEDNIMRGVLATRTYGLACAWSGRPHWFAHPMGLGETIGYTARLTQNNTGLYQNQNNPSANYIHIALMGDPTLRLHPVAPPSALVAAQNLRALNLTWAASTDPVEIGRASCR